MLTLALPSQRELENVETQKEKAAREFSPSIAYLLDWLKEHGGELEKPVHKPPMISVNVPNKQYAWQVEFCTNAAQRSVRPFSQFSCLG